MWSNIEIRQNYHCGPSQPLSSDFCPISPEAAGRRSSPYCRATRRSLGSNIIRHSPVVKSSLKNGALEHIIIARACMHAYTSTTARGWVTQGVISVKVEIQEWYLPHVHVAWCKPVQLWEQLCAFCAQWRMHFENILLGPMVTGILMYHCTVERVTLFCLKTSVEKYQMSTIWGTYLHCPEWFTRLP